MGTVLERLKWYSSKLREPPGEPLGPGVPGGPGLVLRLGLGLGLGLRLGLGLGPRVSPSMLPTGCKAVYREVTVCSTEASWAQQVLGTGTGVSCTKRSKKIRKRDQKKRKDEQKQCKRRRGREEGRNSK